MKPKIAMGNIFSDFRELKEFALSNQFQGIDWSFDLDVLPASPIEESKWVRDISILDPLEVRYHCPFYRIDIGNDDPEKAEAADSTYRRIIRLVSKAGGNFLTIHIGLGFDSTVPLSWDVTSDNLRRLVQFASRQRITLCLENLAWGWTSRPNLFEKLVRVSGSGVTLDIGHAYVSEVIKSQQYSFEDFVTPHKDRVFNAHIYHKERSGRGHLPPNDLMEIKDRLSLLLEIGCRWWVIEVKDVGDLIQTKKIVDDFISDSIHKPLTPAE